MDPSGIYHHHHHPSTTSDAIRNGVHSVNNRSHSVGKARTRAAPVVRLVRVFAPTHVTTDVANFSSIVQKLTGCIAVDDKNCDIITAQNNSKSTGSGDSAVVGRRRLQRSAGGKSIDGSKRKVRRQLQGSTAVHNATDPSFSSSRSTVNEDGRGIRNGEDGVITVLQSSTDEFELRRRMSSDLRFLFSSATSPTTEISVDDDSTSTDEQQLVVDAPLPIWRIHDYFGDDLYPNCCAWNHLVSDFWSPESYAVAAGADDVPPDELHEFESVMMMMTTSIY